MKCSVEQDCRIIFLKHEKVKTMNMHKYILIAALGASIIPQLSAVTIWNNSKDEIEIINIVFDQESCEGENGRPYLIKCCVPAGEAFCKEHICSFVLTIPSKNFSCEYTYVADNDGVDVTDEWIIEYFGYRSPSPRCRPIK